MKTLLVLVVTVLTFSTATAQSAEELLQQALTLERSQGDYNGAIALYKQVSETAGVERKLAGKALVQMARAYENLGRSDAAQTYQRVLDDYGDLPELAAEAREGYARTRETVAKASNSAPGTQQVLDTGPGFSLIGGGLSPSGRYLAAPYYDPMGITYFDTRSGEQTIIPVERRSGHGENVRFSPDDRHIAVSWRGYEPAGEELLLFDVQSESFQVIFDATTYVRSRDVDMSSLYAWGVWPFDWSSDGAEVLAFVNARTEDGGLVLAEFLMIPVDGTMPRLIAGPDLAADFTWWSACLASDERYLLAEVETASGLSGDGVLEAHAYIRRMDMSTGEVVSWRRSGSADTRLAGCLQDGRILYSTSGFGSLALRSADVTDLNGADDSELARLDDESRFGTASDRGDLPLSRDDGEMMLLTFAVGPDGLGGRTAQLGDRFVYELAWSPDGESLAWAQSGLPSKVQVLRPGEAEPRVFEFPGTRLGLVRWDTQNHVIVQTRQEDENSPRLLVIDLDTGDIRPNPQPESGDLVLLTLTEPERWLAWSPSRSCFELHDANSSEPEAIHCMPAHYVSSWFDLSPDGTQAINVGRFEDGSGEAVIFPIDGSGEVRTFPIEQRGEGVSRSRWATSNEALISWGGFNHDSIAFLNLETGEVRPFFPEILQEMRPNKVELAPDGRRLAVFAYPKDIDGRKTTIIRNFAGAK